VTTRADQATAPAPATTWDVVCDTARMLWPGTVVTEGRPLDGTRTDWRRAPGHVGTSQSGQWSRRPDPTGVSDRRAGKLNGVTSEATAHEAAGEVLREYLVLPDRRRPRIAVPLVDGPAAGAVVAHALRKHSHGSGFVQRVLRTALAYAVRLPSAYRLTGTVVGSRLTVRQTRDALAEPARHESFEDHLATIFGSTAVFAFGVGPPRANRKPVLHALTPGGRTLGFVKLGTNDVTRALVRAEAEALRMLASGGREPATFRTPAVVHHGQWRGLEVLVLEDLAAAPPPRGSGRGTGRPGRRGAPVAAMRELAELHGTSSSALAESPFWRRVRTTPDAVRHPARSERFARIVSAVESRYGATDLTLGLWHGDWTPWNMAWSGGGVLLWDLERCAAGVPLGFDLAHFEMQRVLQSRGERQARDHTLRLARGERQLPGQATGFAGNDPGAVWAAYLVELARRYSIDCDTPWGAPLVARTTWLLDLLDDLLRVRS